MWADRLLKPSAVRVVEGFRKIRARRAAHCGRALTQVKLPVLHSFLFGHFDPQITHPIAESCPFRGRCNGRRIHSHTAANALLIVVLSTQVILQLLQGFNDIECCSKGHEFFGGPGGQRFEGLVARSSA